MRISIENGLKGLKVSALLGLLALASLLTACGAEDGGSLSSSAEEQFRTSEQSMEAKNYDWQNPYIDPYRIDEFYFNPDLPIRDFDLNICFPTELKNPECNEGWIYRKFKPCYEKNFDPACGYREVAGRCNSGSTDWDYSPYCDSSPAGAVDDSTINNDLEPGVSQFEGVETFKTRRVTTYDKWEDSRSSSDPRGVILDRYKTNDIQSKMLTQCQQSCVSELSALNNKNVDGITSTSMTPTYHLNSNPNRVVVSAEVGTCRARLVDFDSSRLQLTEAKNISCRSDDSWCWWSCETTCTTTYNYDVQGDFAATCELQVVKNFEPKRCRRSTHDAVDPAECVEEYGSDAYEFSDSHYTTNPKEHLSEPGLTREELEERVDWIDGDSVQCVAGDPIGAVTNEGEASEVSCEDVSELRHQLYENYYHYRALAGEGDEQAAIILAALRRKLKLLVRHHPDCLSSGWVEWILDNVFADTIVPEVGPVACEIDDGASDFCGTEPGTEANIELNGLASACELLSRSGAVKKEHLELCLERTALALRRYSEGEECDRFLNLQYTSTARMVRTIVSKPVRDNYGGVEDHDQLIGMLKDEHFAALHQWHTFFDGLVDGQRLVETIDQLIGELYESFPPSAFAEELDGDGIQDDIEGYYAARSHSEGIGGELFAWNVSRFKILLNSADAVGLQGAPLAILVGDALDMLHSRLETQAPYFDVGCALDSQCGLSRDGTALHETPISQYWGLLASYHDFNSSTGYTFWSSLSATQNPGVDELLGVLRSTRSEIQRHLRVQTGVADSESFVSLDSQNLSLELRPLHRVVAASQARRRNFETQGTLIRDPDVIASWLHEDEVSLPMNAFWGPVASSAPGGLVSTVVSTAERQEAERVALEKAAMQAFEQEAYTQQVDAQIETQQIKLSHALRSLDGLRYSLQSVDDIRSEALMGVEDLVENQAFHNLFAAQPVVVGGSSGSVRPADALYDPGQLRSAQSIADVAVPFSGNVKKLSASAGSVLNFTVTGEWSPSCALTLDGLISPTKNPMTSSAGYIQTFSQSQFKAQSVTEARSVSAQTGAGVNVGGGPASVSAGYQYTSSTTYSQRSGSEQRKSFAFRSGIRLEDTPYPSAPAGSLLVVGVRQGSSNLSLSSLQDVVFADVVQPRYSRVVPEDVDVYLVVNDAVATGVNGNGCEPPKLIDGSLAVKMTHLKPQAQVITEMAAVMNDILATVISTHEADILAQGQILSTTFATLRSQIDTKVASHGLYTYSSQVNDAARSIMEAWINAELNRIEKLVTIQLSEQQVDVLWSELNELEQSKSSRTRIRRVAMQLVQRRVDALEHAALLNGVCTTVNGVETCDESPLVQVLDYAWSSVLPLLTLRYPDLPNQMRTNHGNKLDRFVSLLEDRSYLQRARDFEALFTALRNQQKISPAFVVNNMQNHMRWVLVSIPRPEKVQQAWTNPPYAMPTFSNATQFDLARAATIWDAIDNGEQVAVTVEPRDVYLDAGYRSLECRRRMPVVLDMAFFVTSEEPGLSVSGVTMPLSVEPETIVATDTGPRRYEQINPSLLMADPMIDFVEPSLVEDPSNQPGVGALSQYAANNLISKSNAIGMSLFSSFTMNGADFHTVWSGAPSWFDPTTHVNELVVAFRVATLPTLGSELDWVSTCN